MGLKYGLAGLASSTAVYVPMKNSCGREYSYTKVYLWLQKPSIHLYLRFLDGSLGRLVRNWQFQLEVGSIEPSQWVSTKEQVEFLRDGIPIPKELIIFGGEYTVREIPYEEFLPPPQYHSDEARFESPVGIWNQVVSHCLKNSQMA